MIIDTIEKNNKLLESFKNQSIFDDLKVTVTNSAEIEGCSQIKPGDFNRVVRLIKKDAYY